MVNLILGKFLMKLKIKWYKDSKNISLLLKIKQLYKHKKFKLINIILFNYIPKIPSIFIYYQKNYNL